MCFLRYFNVCSQIFRNLEIFILGCDSQKDGVTLLFCPAWRGTYGWGKAWQCSEAMAGHLKAPVMVMSVTQSPASKQGDCGKAPGDTAPMFG